MYKPLRNALFPIAELPSSQPVSSSAVVERFEISLGLIYQLRRSSIALTRVRIVCFGLPVVFRGLYMITHHPKPWQHGIRRRENDNFANGLCGKPSGGPTRGPTSRRRD
jgi:hypothetical protein